MVPGHSCAAVAVSKSWVEMFVAGMEAAEMSAAGTTPAEVTVV